MEKTKRKAGIMCESAYKKNEAITVHYIWPANVTPAIFHRSYLQLVLPGIPTCTIHIYIHTLVWAFSFSRVSSLICLNKICFSSSSCPLIFCCTSASSATWAWRSSCSTACCWNNCSSSSKTLTVCGNVHVYHDCTWRIWLAGQIPKANSVS